MEFHFSLSLGRGFVRLENTVWYVGDHVAWRAEGNRLIGVPWAGSPARPDRWVAADALWSVKSQSHLTPYQGPWLTPSRGTGLSMASALADADSRESLCWLSSEDRSGKPGAVYRFDLGGEDSVRRIALEDQGRALDAWPVAAGVLLLLRSGLHLLTPRRDSGPLVRQPFQRDARFLGFDAEGLWIRSGNEAFCYREGELVKEALPLEYAGDAWAWRDGERLRLRGKSPWRSHNALRNAWHAFLDGNVLWVAGEGGIARVDRKGLKRFPIPGPQAPRVLAIAPASNGVVALVENGSRKAADVFDGEWRAGSPVSIDVKSAASHEDRLWLATTKGVWRAEAPHWKIEQVALNDEEIGSIGACAEGVAVTTANAVHVRAGRTSVWKTLPAPSQWGMIRSMWGGHYQEPPCISFVPHDDALSVLLANRVDSVFWMSGPGGTWRQLDDPYVGHLRLPGPWFENMETVARWDGGGTLHPRKLPELKSMRNAEPDPGTPAAIWIKDSKALYYLPGPDARILKVLSPGQGRARSAGASVLMREFLASDDWRRAVRDRKGDFWLPVRGGLCRVPSSEAIAGRRPKVLPDWNVYFRDH